MVYEAFLNTLKEEAAQALGEGYTLSLRKIQKNNMVSRSSSLAKLFRMEKLVPLALQPTRPPT